MAKRDFTKTFIEQLNAGPFIGTLYDSGDPDSVTGLYAVCGKSEITFGFQYMYNGEKTRMKIAKGCRLSQAREVVIGLKKALRAGQNPKTIYFRVKEKEQTVQELFEGMLNTRWSQERFVVSGRRDKILQVYNRYIKPRFGTKPIANLLRTEIQHWHDDMAGTPVMANRALETFHAILHHAYLNGWLNANPTDRIEKFREKARSRIPTKDELINILRYLMARAKNPSDPCAMGAVFLLAFFYTGSRPKFLQVMKYGHIVFHKDGGFKVLLPGKTTYKTLKDETAFIPKTIVDLLALHPKPAEDKIFSSKASKGLWNRLVKEFGMKDLWSRDARKAFASVGLDLGKSIDEIGLALNHRDATTTKIYAQEFDHSTIRTTQDIANALDHYYEGGPISE